MQYYDGFQLNTQCGGVELRKSGCIESMFFQAGDDADNFMSDWHSYAAVYGADRACAELWSVYSDAFAFEETPYGEELCRNGITIDDCTCC